MFLLTETPIEELLSDTLQFTSASKSMMSKDLEYFLSSLTVLEIFSKIDHV
jgi:hypothetical protein